MQRLSKVFKNMKKKGIDMAVLINPSNVKYVSDFDVPFWPAWMGDVSNGLPMVTAILNAKTEKIEIVASDLYESKIIKTGIMDANIYRSFTHTKKMTQI